MFNKKRTLITLLAAVMALGFVATQTAWSNRQYRPGGGWIGSGGAGIWNALQIPLDPAGRTAALRANAATLSAEFAGLLTLLGVNAGLSDIVGEMEMVNRDTANYRTVFYGREQVPGNPLQICTIFVMTGTLKFLGPDQVESFYTINAYLPSTDQNGDGYPDEGQAPINNGIFPFDAMDHARRVAVR